MLQPNAEWRWITEEQYLALELGQAMCFKTPYKIDYLCQDTQCSSLFTLEHHEIYSTIADALGEYDCWTGAQKTQIAINALALLSFGKVIAAKSWFFEPASQEDRIYQYQTAYLKVKGVSFQVMVLAFENDCAYCMLLSDEMFFGGNKTVRQFFPIKVMANRLFSSAQ
ncbi:hypothetical protein EYS14_02890 [Alteromonadaceae bacterium M269]|nr:hypothetical protein EYS14_02890 [Alteromonadaceae bacterium M269]